MSPAPGAWAAAGLDIGTSGIKALLLDEDGAEIPLPAVRTPFDRIRGPGGQERIEMSVSALEAALGEVLAALAGANVAGIGIAGMAEAGAPLDADGRPLAPVIAWNDARGEQTVRMLTERFGDSLAQRTGQRPRAVSSAAKLGWLLAHGCPAPSAWLGVPELALRMLTGASATEHSLAGRTGWFDIARRTPIPEVLSAIGASAEVCAPVMGAGAVMGITRPGLPGVPAGVPVTIAGHDHLAGAAGAGAVPGDAVNSVGTAETVVSFTDSLPDVAAAVRLGLATSIRPGGEGYAVLAGAARSGIIVDAAAEELGLPPARLDALAAHHPAPPGWEPVLEDLRARRMPVLPRGEPGAVWAALLEALARRAAEALEGVEGLLGPQRGLLVFGGGAASRPWTAAKARATGLPAWRVRTASAPARGAAVFAGVAAGMWPGAASAPAATREAVVP